MPPMAYIPSWWGDFYFSTCVLKLEAASDFLYFDPFKIPWSGCSNPDFLYFESISTGSPVVGLEIIDVKVSLWRFLEVMHPAINSRRFHINRMTDHQQDDHLGQDDSYQINRTDFCWYRNLEMSCWKLPDIKAGNWGVTLDAVDLEHWCGM